MNRDTDLERWSKDSSFHEGWNQRTHILAGMIPADVKTVLEFGAGMGYLKTQLSDDVEYTPSDLVDRGPGTIVADLNEYPYHILPRGAKYDVVVFSGVLEYVILLREFVNYISKYTDTVVVSYANTSGDSARCERNGWVNSYTQLGFQKLFTDAGYFIVDNRQWQNQSLYTFNRCNIQEK